MSITIPEGDEVYALGLANGKCPVGIVKESFEDGLTLVLFSWLIGDFSGDEVWVPYSQIRARKQASFLSPERAKADGYGWSEKVYDMDPLADFQTSWMKASAT
jgi:hypothetical protein